LGARARGHIIAVPIVERLVRNRNDRIEYPFRMSQPSISVVVPVYNEEAAIGDDLAVIRSALEQGGQPFEIIVVDDGSTDRSRQIVSQLPYVRLLEHPYNRGTGAALKTGIRAADGEIIVMTDGDGSYPNQDIPKLLQYLNGYDMVIGARTSEQGTMKLLRRPAKAFIRWLASFMTGMRIPDLNSGMRAFRKPEAQQFFQILPSGHSWVSTITMAYLSSDYTVKYVPIDYFPRKGKSSFHLVADTYGYLTLVVRVVMYFNPLKVFLPVALTLLLIGIIKFVRDIIFYQNAFYIPGSTIVILLMGVQIAAIGLLADLIVKRAYPLRREPAEVMPREQP
jgi:glycosyltransferase involved in cell wall biosynthesis